MRLDAKGLVSFIHQCYIDDVSFIRPYNWTWAKSERWKILRCVQKNKRVHKIQKVGMGNQVPSPYLRVPNVQNHLFAVSRW